MNNDAWNIREDNNTEKNYWPDLIYIGLLMMLLILGFLFSLPLK